MASVISQQFACAFPEIGGSNLLARLTSCSPQIVLKSRWASSADCPTTNLRTDSCHRKRLLEHGGIARMGSCGLVRCLLGETCFILLQRKSDHIPLLCVSIKVYDTESCNLVLDIAVPNIVELAISPLSNYLSTWERPGRQTPCRSVYRF